ncbi:MAG: hypothetical protein J2O48_12205 [Solirubrobacterales bacterium]|nr:hypothetical protein [Solirubrobacterales bacterium]
MAHAAAPKPQPPVGIFLTDQNLKHALSGQRGLNFTSKKPAGPLITVNPRVRYQTMLGFGAALTDSSASLLWNGTTPSARGKLLQDLVTLRGLNLNFIRTPIGASDFTVGGRMYSYDDMPAKQTDPKLAHFSIKHDQAYIIPELKAMLGMNKGIDMFASMWSPPGWMKANDSMNDVNRRGTLLPRYYGTLAAYFVRYVQAYRAAGVPIWGLAPENEPGHSVAYPSMELKPNAEAALIQDMGADFSAAKLNTRIYGGEMGSYPSYFPFLEKDGSASVMSGDAWHCYGGPSPINDFAIKNPSIQNIMTECSPGATPDTTPESVIDSLRNRVSTVDLWNIAEDPHNGPVNSRGCLECTPLITVPPKKGKPQLTPSYFQLGQFSRYIQRGAQQVSATRLVKDWRTTNAKQSHYGVTTGIDDVAFQNPDGTLVLVAYNNSKKARRFSVGWQGKYFSYTLAPGSTVTFRWNGTTGPSVSRCLNSSVNYQPATQTAPGKAPHASPNGSRAPLTRAVQSCR